MAFPSLLKIVSVLVCLTILITCPFTKVAAGQQTYVPKNEEEVDVLTLVVASEVKANGSKQNEFVCFSINGLDPSATFTVLATPTAGQLVLVATFRFVLNQALRLLPCYRPEFRSLTCP
jgi:hypothetical protein